MNRSGAGTQQVLQLNNSDTTAGTQVVKLAFASSGSTKASINAAVYGNDFLTFNTGSDTERARIDSSGRLGLGTSTARAGLTVGLGSDGIPAAGASTGSALFSNATGAGLYGLVVGANSSGLGYIQAQRADGTATTYDLAIQPNGGRLLVGTSSARTNVYRSSSALTAPVQIDSNADSYSNGLNILNYSGIGFGSVITLGMSKTSTKGTNTVVGNNDELGFINFVGNDGTNFRTAAWVGCEVDGTPGSGDMPGRLVFSTCSDGSASPTERMRISSTGDTFFGKTVATRTTIGSFHEAAGVINATTGDTRCLDLNRQNNDGDLVLFFQAGTQEGSISVSGTTVSYNGAHLSRWSQLPTGAEREEILRGTVLSNIDEMCEWDEEDNEQLNRMKVSDVEGDKNVSGVFQAWDDDDDTYTNDFYCAMTGDFIIRIAEGVTVQRGDLLMSAGDGTAKTQDDDIIRSKTIAKVTSTNVSCTYEDGSYCVPCVLMAC
jgi:hypothetical protein